MILTDLIKTIRNKENQDKKSKRAIPISTNFQDWSLILYHMNSVRYRVKDKVKLIQMKKEK